MKTTLAIIAVTIIISGIMTLALYSIKSANEEEQPPFSVEFPTDDSQVEIHCEIITPV
jgi:hypothetical protein